MTITFSPRPFVLALAFLFLVMGLAHCSRSPHTPLGSPPLSSSPAPVEEASSAQDVEQQLLTTLAEARKLGHANPLLLSTMYSLASFYREHGAFEKAELLYQEALAMKEKVGGPRHQDLVIILNQYAALLREAHRDQEASELEHRAHQIQAFHHNTPSPPP